MTKAASIKKAADLLRERADQIGRVMMTQEQGRDLY